MPIERTYWTAERLQSRKGMDGRTRVEREEDAILISSLTVDGKHAPCLDIDWPTTINEKGDVVVDCDIDPQGFIEFARAFADAGLGEAEMYRPPYDPEEDPGWPPPDRLTLRFCDVPVRVLASSSPGHAHLYIDCELSWESYARLIDTMADAHVLNDGFADNSIDRAMTMLIRPGLTKANLKERGIVIDDYDDDEGDEEVADDSTRGGSPDGAVDPDREPNQDSADADHTEETMETQTQSNGTANANDNQAIATAAAKSGPPRVHDGEMVIRTHSGQFPLALTPDERSKYSETLAELNVRAESIEEKKKQATAALANELKKVKLDIKRLSQALHSGKELREIDVYDVLDRSGGTVETRRMLDGVKVGIRASEHEDRQALLPGTVPGAIPGLDEDLGDDDDGDGEPHELDEPEHDGVTVTASTGGQVHHMPDREDDAEEPDDDPEVEGDEVAGGGERGELHDLAEETRSEVERDDQGDDDLDDDLDEEGDEDDATVITPPGGAPKYDEPEAEPAGASPPAKKKRGAASTPPKKNGVAAGKKGPKKKR